MWKNTVEPGRPELTIKCGACTLHVEYLRLQTHTVRICNSYGFSTATMVIRTRLNVTLIRTLPVLCILFSRNTQKSNFMKIRPVGAELFHVNRHINAQTDMTTIKVALGNFANAPMNSSTIKCTPKR